MCPSDPLETWTRNVQAGSRREAERVEFVRRYIATHRERDQHADDDNLVPICGDCHRGIHLREPAHCRLLLSRLSDAEYAYMIDRGGEDYPTRAYGIDYER